MFDFNANKLTALFIWPLIVLVTGCAQKSETNPVAILDTPPGIEQHKPITLNFKPRITPVSPRHFNQQTDNQDIWPRILDQFTLQDYDNYRIDQQVQHLLRNPEFLVNVQKRAEPYLYYIIEEVEAKQIPGEMALLPVIESAFKTNAYSRSHAAGLWQFIPDTGRFFGLQQNWWYDGRRDIYASTAAATRYLKELAELFEGDWLLALASYNAGKGNVGKAIKRNRKKNLATDYWSLRLPRETMAYVPRLLAVAKIFANAEDYGLELHPIDNKPVFTVVDIGSQIDLAKAAELAKISLEELKIFNPGFNQRHFTPKNGPHRLLIPIEKAEAFKLRLAKLPDSERVKEHNYLHRHKVRRGDNLGLIAKRYQTSVRAIREANQLASARIYPGNHLLIPSPNQAPNYSNSPKRIAKSRIPKRQTYKVRKGDSIWAIARKFSVTTNNLMRWNKLTKKSVLKPGQKLVLLKTKNTMLSSNPFQPINYTVRKGDSLALISRKFNVSVNSLRKWNSLGKYLQPGQKLKVLQPAT